MIRVLSSSCRKTVKISVAQILCVRYCYSLLNFRWESHSDMTETGDGEVLDYEEDVPKSQPEPEDVKDDVEIVDRTIFSESNPINIEN